MTWDRDGLVRRYLWPLAESEVAVSRVLAVLLHHPDARAAFLEAVLDAGAHRPDVTATVERLRADGGPEIVVEPFLANVGNPDLALVSRRRNAVLAIEIKTGSRLRRLQLTRYRLALRDSDPFRDETARERKFATVLLRPQPMHGDGVEDGDRRADPSGFDQSVVLTFAALERLWAAAPAEELRGAGFFTEVALGWTRSLGRNGQPGPGRNTEVSQRRRQLERVAARLQARGWEATRPMTDTRIFFRIPDIGADWSIFLGSRANVCMNLHLGAPFLSRKARGGPDSPPGRLVHLAGGYRSVGIPTLFPAEDRPWSADLPDRQEQQAVVAERIVDDVRAAVLDARGEA